MRETSSQRPIFLITQASLFHLLLCVSLGDALAPSGVTTKPLKYAEKPLDGDLCKTTGTDKNTFRLSKNVNSGLLVRPGHVFDPWGFRPRDFHCNFEIKAPQGEHLFAVIQNISFRRHENGSCIDFVKFRRKDKTSTQQFCGNFDRARLRYSLEYSEDYNDLAKKNASYNYGVHDSKGEIVTTIFVSKEPLRMNEDLNLTMIFTPYKDCEKVDYEQYRTMRYDVCIWREYFCDGYTNCFAGICMDEEYCPVEAVGTGTGTTVTIGAVTTILLCFVIFLMGLWICRRQKKLCWSSDCAGPSAQEHMTSDRESGSNHPASGVGPILEIAVLPPPLDKDLPPSYDSLFPEQPSRAT